MHSEQVRMEPASLTGKDVIHLSVGGRHISTTREILIQVCSAPPSLATVCRQFAGMHTHFQTVQAAALHAADVILIVQAPKSMLALCFGSIWARHQKLDDQGHIVLDVEPYCFQQILSFLTCKLDEQPDTPAPRPVIQQESEADFEMLVDYLQLKEYMALTVADFRFAKAIGMSLTRAGRMAEASGRENACFAAPAMQSGRLYYIKCCISCLRPKAWIFLGVTQLPEPKRNVETDVSSYGWSTFSQYCAGNWRSDDETSCFAPDWKEGDEVVCKVDMVGDIGVLSAWCARFPHPLSVSLRSTAGDPFYFHFGAARDGTVQLLAPTKEDRERFE